MKVTFSCLEATRLISKRQHVKLSVKDTLTLKMHITICNCCGAFEKDLNLIKEKISQMDDHQTHSLDPKVKEDIYEKVKKELGK